MAPTGWFLLAPFPRTPRPSRPMARPTDLRAPIGYPSSGGPVASCDGAHAFFDKTVGAPVQIGMLPDWTRVKGKVAWRVVKGPYSELPRVWAAFPGEAAKVLRGPPDGPAGDVFLCNPQEHSPDRLLTVVYLPAK